MRIVYVQELKMTIFQSTRPPFANTAEVVASEDGSTSRFRLILLTFLPETLVFYPLGFGPNS